MKLEGRAKKLSVYLGESDHYEHKPTYKAIVEALRERGIAGATVLRGVEGYGKTSRIHTAAILRLSEDLPVVIEVIDKAERIESVLPLIREVVKNGLVTIEDVEVISYKSGPEPGAEPG
jgi:hypothetical protein